MAIYIYIYIPILWTHREQSENHTPTKANPNL